jgi:hypothetical protein
MGGVLRRHILNAKAQRDAKDAKEKTGLLLCFAIFAFLRAFAFKKKAAHQHGLG